MINNISDEYDTCYLYLYSDISYLLHFSARCIYTYNKSKCWIYIHKKRERCSIGNKATDRKTLVKEQVTLKLPGEPGRGYWS